MAKNGPQLDTKLITIHKTTAVQVLEETEERMVIHHCRCRFTDQALLNPVALARGRTGQENEKTRNRRGVVDQLVDRCIPGYDISITVSHVCGPKLLRRHRVQGFWEAAALDGAGTWRSLRVALPLASPGVITAALFAFFAAWNEFFIVLILLSNKRNTRIAGIGR